MIRRCELNDLNLLTELAFTQNNIPKFQNSFCCKSYDSIYNDYKNLILSKENLIIGKFDNENLIGFIAFFIDQDRNSADVTGAFINEKYDYKSNFYELWNYKDKFLNIDKYNFFINSLNINLINILNELNAKNNGNEYIYQLHIDNFQCNENNLNITNIKQDQYNDFMEMQDTIFPVAYISGEEIIKRLNKDKEIYVYQENNQLAGYCVVSRNAKVCNIEILAVLPQYRGKHIGFELLNYTIKAESKNFNTFYLVVEKENDIAIKLYQKIGFKLLEENCSYCLE